MSKKTVFDRVEVAAPCSQDWNTMFGNDEVRFCHHCVKNVHDLSAMTRKQAKKLVAQSQGNLCIRYIRRPDGRIQTIEPKLYKIAGRASRIAAGVFGATLTLASAAYAQGGISPNTVDNKGVIERIVEKDKVKTESGFGSISGTVKDPAGAVIPLIIVTLTQTETKEVETAASDAEGNYQFDNVLKGIYELRFEGTAGGFSSTVVDNISLEDGQRLFIPTSMEPANMTETVGGGMAISYGNPLVMAAFDGDLELVQKLLRENVDVNAKEENSNGITALHAAIENGSVEVVRELLQAGAKPNARTASRRTPLMSLDGDAKPELVQLLLTYGARVNSTDDDKAGVLLNAVRNYAEPEVLEMLIQAGAKVDAADKEGKTALIEAASDDNLEAVKVLLGAGADPNLKNAGGETAFSETGSEEIRQLLIAHGAINENEETEDSEKAEPQNQ
ncbi:MAG: ankyrin repeat domain-containing protein [Pyrinomonadaceae bacterium]